MNRDRLNRELQLSGAGWPALLLVYAIILATMVFSALAVL